MFLWLGMAQNKVEFYHHICFPDIYGCCCTNYEQDRMRDPHSPFPPPLHFPFPSPFRTLQSPSVTSLLSIGTIGRMVENVFAYADDVVPYWHLHGMECMT